jgi:hypothetical protein
MSDPVIKNLRLLSNAQSEFVIKKCKGMALFGWKEVSIAWYSDGSRNMIIEDFNGCIYSENIPTI